MSNQYWKQEKYRIAAKIYYLKNKEEIKLKARDYRNKNKEKIKLQALDYRNKHKEEIKLKARNYRKKHKEEMRIYYRNWYKKNGRDRAIDYAEAINQWRKRNPEKRLAHLKVFRAIRRGTLIKPKNCFKCNRETRISAHHKDYTKLLEVLWLCSSCHKLIHNQI